MREAADAIDDLTRKLDEVRVANDAKNDAMCRCGRGGFGCCEDT